MDMGEIFSAIKERKRTHSSSALLMARARKRAPMRNPIERESFMFFFFFALFFIKLLSRYFR